jgi:hypothetical protein
MCPCVLRIRFTNTNTFINDLITQLPSDSSGTRILVRVKLGMWFASCRPILLWFLTDDNVNCLFRTIDHSHDRFSNLSHELFFYGIFNPFPETYF